MNGSDITRLLERYNLLGFKGVWTINAVPDLSEGEFAIYNLSEDEPGTHWAYICCRQELSSNKHFEVFDSLGAKYSDIKKLCSNVNSFVCYNVNRVQPKSSDKCGLYVCLFSIILSENEDLDYFDIMQLAFSDNFEENDRRVVSFFMNQTDY